VAALAFSFIIAHLNLLKCSLITTNRPNITQQKIITLVLCFALFYSNLLAQFLELVLLQLEQIIAFSFTKHHKYHSSSQFCKLPPLCFWTLAKNEMMKFPFPQHSIFVLLIEVDETNFAFDVASTFYVYVFTFS